MVMIFTGVSGIETSPWSFADEGGSLGERRGWPWPSPRRGPGVLAIGEGERCLDRCLLLRGAPAGRAGPGHQACPPST